MDTPSTIERGHQSGLSAAL